MLKNPQHSKKCIFHDNYVSSFIIQTLQRRRRWNGSLVETTRLRKRKELASDLEERRTHFAEREATWRVWGECSRSDGVGSTDGWRSDNDKSNDRSNIQESCVIESDVNDESSSGGAVVYLGYAYFSSQHGRTRARARIFQFGCEMVALLCFPMWKHSSTFLACCTCYVQVRTERMSLL